MCKDVAEDNEAKDLADVRISRNFDDKMMVSKDLSEDY